MTEQFAVEQLIKLQAMTDVEAAMSIADDILIQFLVDIGYNKVADAFEKVPKW